MKKGITFIELLVIVAIIGLVSAIVVPALLRARQYVTQVPNRDNVDYLVLGEGKLEKVEYSFDGQQHTMVYFQNNSVVHMAGINSIGYSRGDMIRISQKRLGAGTEFEKLENSYKVELLEAEAK